jgi:hypothetical protein
MMRFWVVVGAVDESGCLGTDSMADMDSGRDPGRASTTAAMNGWKRGLSSGNDHTMSTDDTLGGGGPWY